jgi:HK97 gp10 family phage protein
VGDDMKVELNYESSMNFFKQEVADIAASMYSQRGKIIRDTAKVVTASVVKYMPESDVNRPLYQHMKTDVKTRIKDDNEGEVIAIIGGGRKTAYKWHLVDNGTSDTPAAHFVDKAMTESESSIEAIMDSAIYKAVSGNGR